MSGPSYWDGARPDAVEKHEFFKKKYGYTPTAHWASTYDCVNLLLTAIQEAGTEGPKIQNWLATKAYGRPIICGPPGNTAKFSEEKQTQTWLGKTGTYFSLFDGTDYGRVIVNKDGTLDWTKIK